MTREEAIEYAEKKNLKLEEEIERHGSYYGAYAMYSTELEFVSMALSALRQQEAVINRNEPLTLDELREMDGEPVWVQFLHNKIGYWYLIDCHNSEFIRFYRSGFFINGEYSKSFLAYRQKPEEGTV